ncbi:TlpA family protein disulfide reductase [Pedobacter sp. KACC 23697]|uniref:Thioredoxin-like domain-containing protein n=1 Tax=Pedobacter sp. KACC 23697 TaxID=3149230 RepID=A0AAU7K9F0_9SPHI
MNQIKILGLLFLSIIYSQKTYSQTLPVKNFNLFVYLENAPFDSLYIHDYTEGRHVFISGKKIRNFTWKITIPENVISDSENMELLSSKYDSTKNSMTSIRFIGKHNNEEIVVANVGVDDSNSYIYGKYLHKTVFSNQPISIVKNDKVTTVIGNNECENFEVITKDPHADIAVRSEDPFFSWFMDSNGNRGDYEGFLTSYISLSKKHPDSRYLLTYLSSNLLKYRTKDDIRKVYENLSDRHKSTIWARKIENFLNERNFPNAKLPVLSKGVAEKIVQDSSKYNLVVFTASWCVPCREEIPLLKKIYADLGKSLVLTYISIDNAKDLSSFSKLVYDEKIPWRSLLAYKDISGIKRKYFIESIPHIILVYPNQFMEILEIRKDNDLERLYSLVAQTAHIK